MSEPQPDPPPVGPAIGVESTRRSLRRYLRMARIASLIAGLLVVTAAWLWVAQLIALDLQSDGVRAAGIIESVSAHEVGNPKLQITFLSVSYRADGTDQHQRISLGKPVGGFHAGQTVTVRYAPHDPTMVEVQGYRSHFGVPPLIPLGIGVIVLAFSWPGIRRARFVHRVLTNDPWDAHPSKLIEVPFGGPMVGRSGRARILIRLQGMTGPVLAAPVGLRRLNPTFTPVAWVAAFGDRQMVVAPPGGSPIVCVRAIEKNGINTTR